MFKAMYAAVSGNEIAAKYDVEQHHCATGGHRYLWKVFNATHRKSKVQVSIFILEKVRAAAGEAPELRRACRRLTARGVLLLRTTPRSSA